jgi:hypothetical protein
LALKPAEEMMMFYGEFDSEADIVREWNLGSFDGEVLYANYDQQSYDGHAVVLFVLDGKFYLVEDSHCSCYGLEDWTPEEMTVPMMRQIAEAENRVYYGFRKEACRRALEVCDELNLIGQPDDVIAAAMKLKYG